MAKSTAATTYLAAVSAGAVGANLDKTVFDGEVSWRRVPGDTSHPSRPGWVPDGPIDPRHYDVAESDRVELSDGAMTSGSATLTSASASFTEDYVGRVALVYGAGAVGISGDVLITSVAAYVSSTELTLADNASATVSGADVVIATDHHAEVVAWLAADGVKRGIPGATIETGVRSGTLVFVADSRVDMAGMTIRQNYRINSENFAGSFRDRCMVENFKYDGAAEMFFERGFAVNDEVHLKKCSFTFDPGITNAETDDNFDATLSVWGAGFLLEDVSITGAFRSLDFYGGNSDDKSEGVIRGLRIENFYKGVTFTEHAEYTVIDGFFNFGSNPGASTNPGNGSLVGGARGVVIKDYYEMPKPNSLGNIKGSGEHQKYASVPDGTQGMTFDRMRMWASGQSALKMRGHEAWRIFELEAGITSVDNASGTNEDVLRQEYCRDGHAVGIRSFKQTTMVAGPSGYDGLHLAHCWDNLYELVSLDRPTRCYLHFSTSSTPNPDYSTSPNNACENLTFRGFEAYNATAGATRPFLILGNTGFDGDGDPDPDTDVKIGDVTILGLDYDGPVASLVETQAAITTVTQVAGTRLYISGKAAGKRITYEWAEGSHPTIHYHDPRDLTDTVANLTALTTAASPGLGEAVVPVGQRAFATDATATTFASAAVGGDENTVPVWWDGADWIIG